MSTYAVPRYERRTGWIFSQIGLYVIVISFGLVMIVPFLWMVSTAFKPESEIFQLVLHIFPKAPTTSNFEKAFAVAPLGRFFVNSVFITSVDTASSIFFAAMSGYAFAKFKVKGGNLIFMLLLSGLMIPFSVRLIPMYLMVVQMGLADTYMGIILPNLLSIMGVFFMRQFAYAVPDDLLDAARIDGSSEFRILWMIVYPMVKPGVAVLGIFKFMTVWNDFLWPLVVINDVGKRTITVGLAMFAGYYSTFYGQFMAASSISILPVFLVFVFFQNQIIKGVSLTGLKA